MIGSNMVKHKYSIHDLKVYAHVKGGICFSNRYSGVLKKYNWGCNCGFRWCASWNDVVNSGIWCPRCGGSLRKTIDDARRLGCSRGFVCLSKRYKNSHSRLRWRCGYGHVWYTSYDKIQQGHGCHVCSISSIGERITRCLFEKIFKSKFKKCRPSWLVISDGRRLELDGYNKDLKIAFEYNGVQHFRPVEYYGGIKAFRDRIFCDKEKFKVCDEYGVRLFRIGTSKFSEIVNDIYKQSIDFCIKIPKNVFNIDYRTFDIYDHDLDDVRLTIENKGGMLNSNTYINAHEKLNVTCVNGHNFFMSSNKIKMGHWCRKCGFDIIRRKRYAYDINDLKAYAISNGFICLSDVYSGSANKHRWRCLCGNIWEATWGNIVFAGNRCPVCANRRRSVKLKMVWEKKRR